MTPGYGEPLAGNGQIQRIRDLERRMTRAEEHQDRDQQDVILERLNGALAQIADLRREVTWLRRTIIALAASIAAAAAVIAQAGGAG